MKRELDQLQQTYYSYIENLKKGIDYIIEEIQNENYDKGFKLILTMVEEIVILLKIEKVMIVNGFFNNSNLKKMNQALVIIVEALENKDYITVKDILEYEIKDLLENENENQLLFKKYEV